MLPLFFGRADALSRGAARARSRTRPPIAGKATLSAAAVRLRAHGASCSPSGCCSRGCSAAPRCAQDRAPGASLLHAPPPRPLSRRRSSSVFAVVVHARAPTTGSIVARSAAGSAPCSRSTSSPGPSCRASPRSRWPSVLLRRARHLRGVDQRASAARSGQDAVRVLDLLGLHLDLPVPADLVRQHPRGGHPLPHAHQRAVAATLFGAEPRSSTGSSRSSPCCRRAPSRSPGGWRWSP